MTQKPSGAQLRARKAAQLARDEEARSLVPCRLANLNADEQTEAKALLARFCDGSLGEPETVAIDLPSIAEDQGLTLGLPQRQRALRIAAIEEIRRTTSEPRERMAALRFLSKLDGSLKADVQTEREQIWSLVERLTDWTWPESLGEAASAPDDLTRRKWRSELRRLRILLSQAADDVAEYRRLGEPVLGVVIRPGDQVADKIGRMSRINLYAQQVAAINLRQQALNPMLSPDERHRAITKLVGVLGLNYQPAETSEWAEKVLDLTKQPDGGAKVLGFDKEPAQ